MDGELKKLMIEAYRQPDLSGAVVESFQVSFNPSTYAQKYDIEYEARQGAGDTSSPQIFSRIKPREYTFELLFDGTGTAIDKVDVAADLEKFLKVTARLDGEIHRPVYLKLSWGPLVVRCVLKLAEVTYTLFDPGGSPLRARVRATFAEMVDDKLRVAEERKASPDLTHVHTVIAGDHLPELTHRYYGDARYYLQVADHNQLANFRQLVPGQRLVFPPIRDASAEATP